MPGTEVVELATPAKVVITPAAATPEVTDARRVAASHQASEDSLRSEGQRAINVIWETTQMKIALSVIWASLVVSLVLSIFGGWLGTPDVQLAAVVFLFGVANLVTGFYFGRTNHQRIGGIGGDAAQQGGR